MLLTSPSHPTIFLVLIALGPVARGDENKIRLSDVPRVVTDAIKAKYPSAELKKASKETEERKTTFEVSLKNKGTDLNVSVSDKGKILEVERAIRIQDLPGKVRDAIEKKYPKATLKEAEEVTDFDKGEEEKSYEVKLVKADGKSLEVTVEEDGEIEEEEGGNSADN